MMPGLLDGTRRSTTLIIACVLLLGASCQDGQRLASGQGEPLVVEGASFVQETLPSGGAGPEVRGAFLSTSAFPERTQGKTFSGVLGETATAIAIALSSSAGVAVGGHWVVPAGPPRPDFPASPSFSAPLSFGEQLLPGSYAVDVVAIDGTGLPGAPRTVTFELTPRATVEGELVFTLDWDHNADLDLRVETPSGQEISRGDNVASGEGGWGDGRLDFDSNGDCDIDGRRTENVYFEAAPQPGTYRVRVDTFSLCGEVQARWRVTARHQGDLVAATEGLSLPTDTRFAHVRGSGVTALSLEVE